LFYYAGYLPVYNYAPFMVAASTLRGLRSIYEGVYTVREYGQGVYFPTWEAA
jgi:hypothetical protein